MQVVRQRPEVIEELAVDRPALVLLPDLRADHRCAQFGHHVAQQHTLVLEDHVAQALVRHASRVGRLGGRTEPALIDAAAVEAEGKQIIRVQLQPAPRITKHARHPIRCQPQHTVACVQRGVRDAVHLLAHSLQLFYRSSAHGQPPLMTSKTKQNTLESYASTFGMSCKAPFNMCILSAQAASAPSSYNALSAWKSASSRWAASLPLRTGSRPWTSSGARSRSL